jgi:hypothetical protein
MILEVGRKSYDQKYFLILSLLYSIDKWYDSLHAKGWSRIQFLYLKSIQGLCKKKKAYTGSARATHFLPTNTYTGPTNPGSPDVAQELLLQMGTAATWCRLQCCCAPESGWHRQLHLPSYLLMPHTPYMYRGYVHKSTWSEILNLNRRKLCVAWLSFS